MFFIFYHTVGTLYQVLSDGSRGPVIDKIYSAYVKESPSYQYATKVMNVSSFWGTTEEYSPGRALGPQDVFLYGDCSLSWYVSLSVYMSTSQPTYLPSWLSVWLSGWLAIYVCGFSVCICVCVELLRNGDVHTLNAWYTQTILYSIHTFWHNIFLLLFWLFDSLTAKSYWANNCSFYFDSDIWYSFPAPCLSPVPSFCCSYTCP